MTSLAHTLHSPSLLASCSAAAFVADTAPQTALSRDCTACRQKSQSVHRVQHQNAGRPLQADQQACFGEAADARLRFTTSVPSSAFTGLQMRSRRPRGCRLVPFAPLLRTCYNICAQKDRVLLAAQTPNCTCRGERRGSDGSRGPRDPDHHIAAHLSWARGTQAGRAVPLTGRCACHVADTWYCWRIQCCFNSDDNRVWLNLGGDAYSLRPPPCSYTALRAAGMATTHDLPRRVA